MPEQEEPLWPSDDSDGGDGAREADAGSTAQLPVRKVTFSESQTAWIERPKQPEEREARPASLFQPASEPQRPDRSAGSLFTPGHQPEPASAPVPPPPPPPQPQPPRDQQDFGKKDWFASAPPLGQQPPAAPGERAPSQPQPPREFEQPQVRPRRPASLNPDLGDDSGHPGDRGGRQGAYPERETQELPVESWPRQPHQQPQPDQPRPVWQRPEETPGQREEFPERETQQLPVRPPQPRQDERRADGPPPQQLPPVPPAPHALPVRIEPSGELRPAEATTGAEPPAPPPAAEPGPDVPPKKRKRRGLLIGSLALVLVIAVGVALALPVVSNRLALPWAPNAPKGPEPSPVPVALQLKAPDTSKAAPTPAAVQAALAGPAGNSALGTLTGSVLDPATGTTLWNRDPGQPLTPASTTKLLTTAAALLAIDHGKQISTKVVQGASPDTAVIVGGGDVTLSSLPKGKDPLYPGGAHLDDLVSQVKNASGGRIKNVQIDLSLFSGPTTAPGLAAGDVPTYTASMVPAMLDAGRLDPSDDHSARTPNPAADLAKQFADRLGANVAGTMNATAPQGAKVLGEVKSAPITELVSQLLQASDNTLADAVARQTAIATGKPATFEGGAAATLDVLKQHNFDLTGVELSDNSGLSTLNKVPSKVLAEIVGAAAAPEGKDERSAKLRPILVGLPVAGGTGTLASRYADPNSSGGKGWVRAKTGSLSGVNTLAGVVLDKDGRVLVFALMSNGGSTDPSRKALDAIAAKLKTCGCT
ncbi:D-alanyl-D-alanine carboxypeptidase/D-alanyl-D-alanine endopeptidase [Amycolatopsis sp. CA-230715]|uniref:D-alanyl-D-alanine carboxypeptidase/D-alanyl-D-alanine endopeptidase n=1 Tax=Amycolatopsis sp. CA-230715 TaxID=2745196 RepID=UPI001C014EF4|nr:D-alanyl-D-alanine carboxypeptidase/D-alanyl-D-alanine-endopeptidase [Amycolatopsis sp. CA-230715]QWF81427.1 hypothetical protein HUW46_04859 [Amycolatopsis sp. CA-230715]